MKYWEQDENLSNIFPIISRIRRGDLSLLGTRAEKAVVVAFKQRAEDLRAKNDYIPTN